MKKATILICLIMALAGCGSDKERPDTSYTTGATKGRPLDMPPDLVLPKAEGKYVVPSGGTEMSATYSEYAKSGALQGQSCVCQNAAAAQGAAVAPVPASAVPATKAAAPALQDRPDGSKMIVIAEPFDRCWLRVSQAMDAAGIAAEDKDRSKGQFYLKGHNQLNVQGNVAGASKAQTCEISAASASGASTADTKRITDALFKALGQQ